MPYWVKPLNRLAGMRKVGAEQRPAPTMSNCVPGLFLFLRRGDRVATAVALARILALAAVVAGLATALALTIVLALALVFALLGIVGELAECQLLRLLRIGRLRGISAGYHARQQAGHGRAGQQYLGASLHARLLCWL